MQRSPPQTDSEKSEGRRNKPTRSPKSSQQHSPVPKETDSRFRSWTRPPTQMGKEADGEARRKCNPSKNFPLENAEQSPGIDVNQLKLTFPFPPRRGHPFAGYSLPGTQRLPRSRPPSAR